MSLTFTPVAWTINFLRPQFIRHDSKLECLTLSVTSTLDWYLRVMLQPIRAEPLTRHHSNDRLLPLQTNIYIWWTQIEVANTLAYYDTTTIIDVKSFIVHAPVACTIKIYWSEFILYWNKLVRFSLSVWYFLVMLEPTRVLLMSFHSDSIHFSLNTNGVGFTKASRQVLQKSPSH
jgi:hypothetical protein